jgi:hypothetical protein
MIKKLFNWTPRDIAYWEKLRSQGLGHFIVWYGVLISGGSLFILASIVSLIIWIWQYHAASLVYLGFLLFFAALVCLFFGVINSLITWFVEERLYIKYKTRNTNPH